jgi:hypothetical protein
VKKKEIKMRKENGFWPNSAELPRKYSADDFMGYFKDFFTDGVLGDDSTKLQVTAAGGMDITISPGTAYADGHFFAPKEAKTIALSPSDTSYGRIDLICIRVDYAKKTVYFHVEEGLTASSPVCPSVTRDGNYYDLGIASVFVAANVTSIRQGDITDLRYHNDYCGQVVGKIETIDTTTLFAQYEAQWELLKAACENDAEGVIKAWESLNAVKKVCDVSPVNGNVPLTMDNIAQGSTYEKYLIQSGTFSTTSAGPKTVTFPKSYISAPIVIGVYIPKDTDDSQYWRVGSCNPVTVTKSSVTLTYYRGTSFTEPTNTYPATYRWIAIGKV